MQPRIAFPDRLARLRRARWLGSHLVAGHHLVAVTSSSDAAADQASLAVRVIDGTEASAREIGQFFLASSARDWNCSALRPGTVPRVSRAMATIDQPASCF